MKKQLHCRFFWCRGRECYQNNLHGQTLEQSTDWHDYTLYHLIEIIKYPKLKSTEAGYEPDSVVREFIAVANKAMKTFARLKCSTCGHLLFSLGGGDFAVSSHFACINPSCSEYNHDIYLSYCYRCKKGLIDSRDSKQCSNGWYICPDCHSCCDDSLYDRMAQRYILQNNPVPQRIQSKLGHGHNDKGLFFCHQCGTQLEINVDNGNGNMRCPQCNVLYERLLR